MTTCEIRTPVTTFQLLKKSLNTEELLLKDLKIHWKIFKINSAGHIVITNGNPVHAYKPTYLVSEFLRVVTISTLPLWMCLLQEKFSIFVS